MHPYSDLDLLKWGWHFIISCQSSRVKHLKNIVWLWVEVLFIASGKIMFLYFFVYFIIYITPLFLFLNSIWWIYLCLVHFLTLILLYGFSGPIFYKWSMYIPKGNIILRNCFLFCFCVFFCVFLFFYFVVVFFFILFFFGGWGGVGGLGFGGGGLYALERLKHNL